MDEPVEPLDGGEPDPPVIERLPSGLVVAPMALKRMSAVEFDRALDVLLGDDSGPGRGLLPEDPRTPFDSDYLIQSPSLALAEGLELIARGVAERFVEDAPRLAQVLGCTPSSPDDRDCMRTFLSSLARRAYRRPIEDADLDFLMEGEGAAAENWPGAVAIALEEDDFNAGVRAVVELILQEPEFVYRVEIGSPHEDSEEVLRLSAFEIATRLAFFVWGTIPDDALLDRAADGSLHDPAVRFEEAQRLLSTERAQFYWTRFHAMWLGYERLVSESSLGVAMQNETAALMERVLFVDAGPWQDLFRYEATYVDAELAEHYGLPAPSGESGFVDYAMDLRRGLFAHGSFLGIGIKDNDTSPTMRGIAVQSSAFCLEIREPPLGVDADNGPQGDGCKPSRYAAHASGGCAGCHADFDPVGFGLENFDATGAYREFEVDDPATEMDESTCRIEGSGNLRGVGVFEGPAGLAELALSSGRLRSCFVEQVHRTLVGRGELRPIDEAAIEEFSTQLPEGDFRLVDVVEAIVVDETFALRRIDTEADLAHEGEGE